MRINSNVFREPQLFLLLILLLLIAVLVFYFVASMITSVGYQTFAGADSYAETSVGNITIVIDAGHGGEDPGAVVNNTIEKDLNLLVSKKLIDFLCLSGYEVVLTRSDDRMLYNDGEEDRKKYYDLRNRLKIVESVENPIFISIHMNKFPLDSCKGLQTFYSVNHDESMRLAQYVQDASKMLDYGNKRLIKPVQDSIYLLEKLKTPAILVECGFLSNPEEATMLSDSVYQNKLSFALCHGIINFLEEGRKSTG